MHVAGADQQSPYAAGVMIFEGGLVYEEIAGHRYICGVYEGEAALTGQDAQVMLPPAPPADAESLSTSEVPTTAFAVGSSR